MSPSETRARLDRALETAVAAGAPGIVAMASDREHVLYQGAAGTRRLGEGETMTIDSLLALFSCSKAITATAALQMWEHGLLNFDAPAKLYAPDIGTLEVLEGFDEEGAPMLRPPRREITVRMLLTHTAGFGYDFFNSLYGRLKTERGQVNPRLGLKAGLKVPLLFDPGERWEYGLSIDWLGQAIEGAAGERLDAVLATRVFEPLGMTDTGFKLSSEKRARRASMHEFDADGALKPMDFVLPETPEVFMGGGGLFGTAPDYMRFLRMWLNDGMGEFDRVLRPETVEYAARNHLGDLAVVPLPAINPAVTRPLEFFPGVKKSWALSFLRNEEAAPTGRPAGALGWAGLGNLYYWLDRENGLAGFWAAQMFPFLHEVALDGFMRFETEVYQGWKAKSPTAGA